MLALCSMLSGTYYAHNYASIIGGSLILAVGDRLTDVSTILVFVCKNRVILAEFQHIDGSARWLTSFNYNHTPHAGTLPSTGHC